MDIKDLLPAMVINTWKVLLIKTVDTLFQMSFDLIYIYFFPNFKGLIKHPFINYMILIAKYFSRTFSKGPSERVSSKDQASSGRFPTNIAIDILSLKDQASSCRFPYQLWPSFHKSQQPHHITKRWLNAAAIALFWNDDKYKYYKKREMSLSSGWNPKQQSARFVEEKRTKMKCIINFYV